MKTYTVHLIRHGQTEGNIKGQYIGRTDLPLSTNGIIEIESLKAIDIYPDVDAIYISPLLRCRQTAEIIFPNREIVPIDNFIEYDFGEFEGKTANELEDCKEYFEWTSGKITAPPCGEDAKDFSSRICLGLNEVVRHLSTCGGTEGAVVVHGGVIMSLLAACGLPQRPIVEWACGNGRGYTVRITPSLYARSGVIEIVGEIPPGEAALLTSIQSEIIE